MSSVETTVARVLRMAPSEITEETAMRTTPAWDSLSHMEMVTAIEAAFGVRLSMDDIVAMTSVAGLRNVLRAHGVDA